MKNYYRVMLGQKSIHAAECRKGDFIGVDFQINMDLAGKLPEDWKQFNKQFVPIYLESHPEKNKVAAGLACGAIWTVSKGIQVGEIVLCPDGSGNYMVGEIVGEYAYHPSGILPHRRPVKWHSQSIPRSSLSREFLNAAGIPLTACQITKHAEEIEGLIQGSPHTTITTTDDTIEDVSTFALEKHLEEFLVHNWSQTELGKNYDIYEVDGELVGQQYPSDTGPIDILAISKDKKELLVVELKKGRASDHVVGQIQRYMGFVVEELAEEGQKVKGVILALEDDLRIRRALAVTTGIEFYRYQVSFRIFKG